MLVKKMQKRDDSLLIVVIIGIIVIVAIGAMSFFVVESENIAGETKKIPQKKNTFAKKISDTDKFIFDLIKLIQKESSAIEVHNYIHQSGFGNLMGEVTYKQLETHLNNPNQGVDFLDDCDICHQYMNLNNCCFNQNWGGEPWQSIPCCFGYVNLFLSLNPGYEEDSAFSWTWNDIAIGYCLDETDCENPFDYESNCDCEEFTLGCTNESSCHYNANAIYDDGSCWDGECLGGMVAVCAGVDQTVLPNSIMILDGSESLAENCEFIAYEWTQLSGPNLNLDDESVSQEVTVPPTEGEIELRLSSFTQNYDVYEDRISIFISCPNEEGDATSDELVDMLDIVSVINHILGTIELSEEEICAADMDDDGVIDVLDIDAIVDLIINPPCTCGGLYHTGQWLFPNELNCYGTWWNPGEPEAPCMSWMGEPTGPMYTADFICNDICAADGYNEGWTGTCGECNGGSVGGFVYMSDDSSGMAECLCNCGC